MLAQRTAPGAGWMQINAACSGFSYAVSTADSLVRCGSAERVLIVAAEQMSDLLNPDDLGTSIIFGDGAGAALIGPNTDGGIGIGPVIWRSDGDQSDLIECTSDSGNTSAASIPITLTRLNERRIARPGQLALLLGFGAGFAYTGQVVQLP